jgi:cobalt-zinc-cadmium efflux system protein
VTPEKRLGLVLVVNVTMILALLLVGVLAHSLGVLASAADYLGDALGTGLSLAGRRSGSPPETA